MFASEKNFAHKKTLPGSFDSGSGLLSHFSILRCG